MKRILLMSLAAALLLSILNPQLSTVFAQGSLTPPGGPGPTMKTLDQIEPRTPISSAPYTITQSGSYYLTTNLTVSSSNAIYIATSGVTLDLNGFTISSTAANPTGAGIMINARLRNITIANGFIQGGVTNDGTGVYSGPGFAFGILVDAPILNNTNISNVRVSGISVSGCMYAGIALNYLNNSTMVESCMVQTVGGLGIRAGMIKQSLALDCGGEEQGAIIGYEVYDCYGETTGLGEGVSGLYCQNCVGSCLASVGGNGVITEEAQNCSGYTLNGNGIQASIAYNCTGSCTNGNGVSAYNAVNCHGYSGWGGAGVYCQYTAQNCYGYNYVNGGSIGLEANTALNCYGSSGSANGLDATTAQNCYGYSGSGTGLSATTAQNCYGSSGSGGTGLSATTAVGCYGASSSGTGLQAFIANSCSGSSLDVTHSVNSY